MDSVGTRQTGVMGAPRGRQSHGQCRDQANRVYYGAVLEAKKEMPVLACGVHSYITRQGNNELLEESIRNRTEIKCSPWQREIHPATCHFSGLARYFSYKV